MTGEHIRRGVVAVLLALPCLALAASGAEPAEKPTGWAELSGIKPGTAIVVLLSDGRHLERFLVSATADALNTVDLSLVSSRNRRGQILDLVREYPERYEKPVFVEQDGTLLPITQRIDRSSIVLVSRPKSMVFVLRTPVDWMLHYSGPCPNCDTAQTALTGRTPLPSPLPRKAEIDPLLGEVLYRAPAAAAAKALDDLTWEQLRLILPASLRGR
jgi:hypothetical protein